MKFRILFLEHFKFDWFNTKIDKIPLKVFGNTYLDNKPYITKLNSEDDKQDYKIINYLDFLTNYNGSNLCFKSYKPNNKTIWQIIKLLRLIKPFQIFVRGSLEYKNENELNNENEKNILIYNQQTIINCDNNNYKRIIKNKRNKRCNDPCMDCNYTENDFNKTVNLNKKIKLLIKIKPKQNNIINAFNLFVEADLMSSTYNQIFLLLFASLESLFKSPAKGKALSKLVDSFIGKKFRKKENIESFIKKQYEKKRNLISHGNPLAFSKDKNVSKYKSLVLLHEIVRLSIIQFLETDEEILKSYLENNKIKIQNFIKKHNNKFSKQKYEYFIFSKKHNKTR